MSEVFAAGGVWNIITTVLCVMAVSVSALQYKDAGKRNYCAPIIGLTLTIAFVSLLAYGLGMWNGLHMAGVAKSPQILTSAEAFAATALAWGGLMGIGSSLFGTVAIQRHIRAS